MYSAYVSVNKQKRYIINAHFTEIMSNGRYWGILFPSSSIISRYVDDMMGVHLKVKEEVEKKKAENLASGEELLPLNNEMIISSCMQVSFTANTVFFISTLGGSFRNFNPPPPVQRKLVNP
jgi:hypothetical protein